ncbi:hypothetical protein QBC41DRAFT_331799 [Cercophora samala]|uniref:Transmembrane protein n=1 Tax=Cercophora samala TaxID=330535 RepID=A0AA40D0W2_9PEZI|nr:hypothetical protein QBC41DRAFT_331799 [Cercophora samala]
MGEVMCKRCVLGYKYGERGVWVLDFYCIYIWHFVITIRKRGGDIPVCLFYLEKIIFITVCVITTWVIRWVVG